MSSFLALISLRQRILTKPSSNFALCDSNIGKEVILHRGVTFNPIK